MDATECARIFDLEPREVQRRIKDPTIRRHANNRRPPLLNPQEIEAIRRYIDHQYYSGFPANRDIIVGAVKRLL